MRENDKSFEEWLNRKVKSEGFEQQGEKKEEKDQNSEEGKR